jgi:hypothetical protein
VYLVITCVCAIASIYRIFGGTADSAAKAGLAFFVYFTIYMGLRHRKKWVLIIILIFSAFALLTSFLSSVTPAKNVASLSGKVIDIVFVLFSAYQIYFFSKKEVKKVFNTKGTIIY